MLPDWRVVRSGAALCGVVLGLSGLIWADPGKPSPPGTGPAQPARTPAPTKTPHDASPERIHELEARIAELEGRLAAMERRLASLQGKAAPEQPQVDTEGEELVPLAIAREECASPYFVDTRGIRRVDVNCLVPPSNAPCDPPYTVDSAGIRRPKTQCAGFADVERHSTADLTSAAHAVAESMKAPHERPAQTPPANASHPSPQTADADSDASDPDAESSSTTPGNVNVLPPGACNPPWQIDTRGVRRLRPWCFDTH